MIFQLPHYGSLSIAGDDAKKFLQGQLTCNLDQLEPRLSIMGAHCNPKGRIISLFHCLNHHHSYLLLMPQEMIAIAASALKKYALFFKVTCTDTSQDFHYEGITTDELKHTTENQDNIITLNPSLAIRIKPDKKDHQAESATTAWDQQLIAAKIPVITPTTSQTFLPHELNLEAFNAIAYDKGCYTGQEIIARMHYRSQVKDDLHQASIQTEMRPAPGLDIHSSQNHATQVVGRIVNVVEIAPKQYQLLITIKDPRFLNQPLFLNNEDPVPVTLHT